jgi:hypothetical protein
LQRRPDQQTGDRLSADPLTGGWISSVPAPEDDVSDVEVLKELRQATQAESVLVPHLMQLTVGVFVLEKRNTVGATSKPGG